MNQSENAVSRYIQTIDMDMNPKKTKKFKKAKMGRSFISMNVDDIMNQMSVEDLV